MYEEGYNLIDIQKKMHFTRYKIKKISKELKKIGIIIRRKESYSTKKYVLKDEIINLYKEKNMSVINISKKLNISTSHIYNILKCNNIKVKKTKKYSFNENYFEKIDTEEKAYWLGFIYADGNVYKNTVCLKLGKKDKYHLTKFKNNLNATYKIESKNEGQAYRILLSSKKLCYDLKKHGVVPNKHDKLIFPNISDNLIRHFIRGFFDGDGWICFSKNKFYLSFSSCSSEIILSIRKIIKNNFKKDGSFFVRKYNQFNWKDVFQLSYAAKEDVHKVLNYMYHDVNIYLDRKYNLFKLYKKECNK